MPSCRRGAARLCARRSGIWCLRAPSTQDTTIFMTTLPSLQRCERRSQGSRQFQVKRSDDKGRREIASGGPPDRLAVRSASGSPIALQLFEVAVSADAQGLCQSSLLFVGPPLRSVSYRPRDLGPGRSRFRVGFEFAQILLGPRSADRGFPFRPVLPCRLVDATQLLMFGSRASYYQRKKNPPGPEREK